MLYPLLCLLIGTVAADDDFWEEIEDYFEDLDWEDILYIAISLAIIVAAIGFIKKYWKKHKKQKKASKKQAMLDKEQHDHNVQPINSTPAQYIPPPQQYPPVAYPPQASYGYANPGVYPYIPSVQPVQPGYRV